MREVPFSSERGPIPVVTTPEFAGRTVPGVEEIRSGSEAAFDRLFRIFYPRLCGYVARITRSPEVAEELVQEIFTSVWERRHIWEPRGSPDQYLYRAARNRALKYLRQQEVRARFQGKLAGALSSRSVTPEELLDESEISIAVQTAIDSLPDRCRDVFLLSREAALTYVEIAEMMEISVKTVETQMGRALKVIRSRLLRHLS